MQKRVPHFKGKTDKMLKIIGLISSVSNIPIYSDPSNSVPNLQILLFREYDFNLWCSIATLPILLKEVVTRPEPIP